MVIDTSLKWQINKVFITCLLVCFIFFQHVDHSEYNSRDAYVMCTSSQVLSWLELAARSLLSIAPAPQVRCSNEVMSRDGNKFVALPEIEVKSLCIRVIDLNHCATYATVSVILSLFLTRFWRYITVSWLLDCFFKAFIEALYM